MSDLTHNRTHLRSEGHKHVTKFGADLSLKKKSNTAIFQNSRANNAGRSGPLRPIFKLIPSIGHLYVDQVRC